jgi:hypothetical protein
MKPTEDISDSIGTPKPIEHVTSGFGDFNIHDAPTSAVAHPSTPRLSPLPFIVLSNALLRQKPQQAVFSHFLPTVGSIDLDPALLDGFDPTLLFPFNVPAVDLDLLDTQLEELYPSTSTL